MVTVTHEYISKPIELVHLNTVPLIVCKLYLNKIKKKTPRNKRICEDIQYKTHKVNTQK